MENKRSACSCFEKLFPEKKIISLIFGFLKKKSGFTLLEISVVIAIIVMLSTLFLSNYRGGEKNFSLKRSAHKLAQDIRTVQGMALSSDKTPPSFSLGDERFPKGGYGLYFPSANTNSYILFADCNNNKKYDSSGASQNCTLATLDTPYGELIQNYSLEESIKIISISPSPPLSIVFFPPDPTVTITDGSGATSSSSTIQMSYDGQKIQTVSVNELGRVEIY